MARLFWGLFCASLVVYLAMVFWTVPHLAALADGQIMLDMRPFGYGHAEVQAYLEALGDTGRNFYLTVQHRLDLAYPALLGASFVTGFVILWRGALRWTLIAAALLGAVADYIENAHVAALLRADDISEAAVQTASFWTQIKSGAVTVCFVALLIGAISLMLRKWRGTGGIA